MTQDEKAGAMTRTNPPQLPAPSGSGGLRVDFTLPADKALGALFRHFNLSGADGLDWLPFRHLLPSEDAEELDDPYMREAWVIAAVDLLATAAASVKMRIWDRDPEDPNAREVLEGPVHELFERVNPLMTPSLLSITDAISMGLSGEAFWLLVDRNMKPVPMLGEGRESLIDLPDTIVPMRGTYIDLEHEGGMEKAWLIPDAKGTRKRWPIGAVVQQIELPHPRRMGRGIGRVEKAWSPADQLFLAQRYQGFMLRNNGAPAGVVQASSWLGKPQEDFARSQVEDLNDQSRAGSVAFLPDGVKWIPNRTSPKDLEYGKLIDAKRQDVSAVFTTPGALLGLDTESYATFRGHWQTYLGLRVAPYLRLRDDAINRQLFMRLRDPRFREYRVRSDFEDLEAAFRDFQEIGVGLQALRDAGLPLTVAAGWMGLKLDPVDGDDVSWVEAGKTPARLAVLQQQATTVTLLTGAGADRRWAFDEVGLKDAELAEAPMPPEEPDPDDEPMPDDEGEEPAGDEGEEEGGEQMSAAARAQGRLERAVVPSADDRARDLEAQQRALAGPIRRLTSAIRSVLYPMRRAQLEAFRLYAETGRVPREAVYGFRACPDPVREQGEPTTSLFEDLVRHAPRRLPRKAFEAWAADHEHASAAFGTPRGERGLLWERPGIARTWASCNGLLSDGVHPGCGVHPACEVVEARLLDVEEQLVLRHLVERLILTEAEIAELLVVNDEAWQVALSEKMIPVLATAEQVVADDLAARWGFPRFNMTEQRRLIVIQQRAIRVVEGTTSVIARQARSDLVRVLAGADDGLSLRDAIRDSLRELQADTTKAFNSHSQRAEAIARTETGIAANSSSFDVYREAYARGEIAGIVWIDSDDAAVRASHNIGGQQRIPGNPFTLANGTLILHPLADGAPPEEVIRCRCGIMPLVDEEPLEGVEGDLEAEAEGGDG